MLFNVHDHSIDLGKRGGSGYEYDIKDLPNGKMQIYLKGYNSYYGIDGKYSNDLYITTGRVIPLYVYYPNAQELYKYTPWDMAAKKWNVNTTMLLQKIIRPNK
jgi:hypothetical protein